MTSISRSRWAGDLRQARDRRTRTKDAAQDASGEVTMRADLLSLNDHEKKRLFCSD